MRNPALLLFLAAGCQSPDGPRSPPSADPATAASAADPAQGILDDLRAMRVDQLDAALVRMDGLVGEMSQNAAFWDLYGESMVLLIERELAAGRSISHLPEDAIQAFATALELEPARNSARLLLARSHRLSGNAEAAWQAAEQVEKNLDPALANLEALEEIGRCGLALTVQALQAGEPAPAAAAIADQALQLCLQRGGITASLPLFDLRAWQAQWEPAADAARIGLLATPQVETLYDRLRGLSGPQRNLQVATLETVRRGRTQDGQLLWYLGEALYFQGRETRAARDTQKALEAFQRAQEFFFMAQSARPDFAASCQDWLHIIRVQEAWTWRDEGKRVEAGNALVAALAAGPGRLEAQPEPETMRLAIEAVAADFFRANDLAGARAFLREICRLHSVEANWLNNLAFACRDLGVAASEAGDTAAAATLFEESWSAYSRAVEYAPTDARIINDRALIAVYYLDEHWDLAEQELQRAIQIGTRQLAELPSDVPETERQDLDEAVGDAWENLAYLQLVRRHRTERVEEYLLESLKHFPRERRAGVALLRARLDEAQRQP